MNEIEQAKQFLKTESTDLCSQLAEKLIEDGTAKWRLDPYHPQVVGLVNSDRPDEAYVIVWLDEQDFELSDEFEKLLYTV